VASTEPVLIKTVQPRYPTQARRSNQEGWVVVSYNIDAEGNVNTVKVLDAQPRHLFDREAVNAVERWKFKPATRNGVPVEASRQQRIVFTLNQ
jgi:periplasmic protein TonB